MGAGSVEELAGLGPPAARPGLTVKLTTMVVKREMGEKGSCWTRERAVAREQAPSREIRPGRSLLPPEDRGDAQGGQQEVARQPRLPGLPHRRPSPVWELRGRPGPVPAMWGWLGAAE